MKPKSLIKRKATNILVMLISVAASAVGILILCWILIEVLRKGMGAFSWNFFTKLPAPPGEEGGGVANAIYGTGIITLVASVIGIPLGLLSGIFLAEFGQQSRIADTVRFLSNVLMGTPSIIVGIFVYGLIVVPLGHFSGYAGAVALAIIMLPLISRTTEDMLNMVPDTLRESALALGASRWRVTLNIIFRAAKRGMITGTLLAIARISGETAPLLFTSLNSSYWPHSLAQPTSNLTVTIFNYAMSPFEDWQRIAWGASLLITMAVLCLTVLARFVLRERGRR